MPSFWVMQESSFSVVDFWGHFRVPEEPIYTEGKMGLREIIQWVKVLQSASSTEVSLVEGKYPFPAHNPLNPFLKVFLEPMCAGPGSPPEEVQQKVLFYIDTSRRNVEQIWKWAFE